MAMALACDPDVLIADEPTTALDVTIPAQFLNLLLDLQARFGIAYLFISHDLRVVRDLADRVAVMYQGRIVEIGASTGLYANPQHPYTEALFSAVPAPECTSERPDPCDVGAGHLSACHLAPY